MPPRPPTPGRSHGLASILHVPRPWLETRTARRLQTPRARLALLAATVVLATLYAVALAVDDPGGTFWSALVLFIVVASAARLAGGPIVGAAPGLLDERELAERGRVMGLAFNASVAVFVLVLALTAVLARPVIAGSAETVDPGRLPAVMMAPLLFAMLVHSVAPVAVLSWIERDRSSERDAPRPTGAVGPRRVTADDPAARRAGERPRPVPAPAPPLADPDPTATIAPDGAGLPVTHDFPVVEDQAATRPRDAR